MKHIGLKTDVHSSKQAGKQRGTQRHTCKEWGEGGRSYKHAFPHIKTFVSFHYHGEWQIEELKSNRHQQASMDDISIESYLKYVNSIDMPTLQVLTCSIFLGKAISATI